MTSTTPTNSGAPQQRCVTTPSKPTRVPLSASPFNCAVSPSTTKKQHQQMLQSHAQPKPITANPKNSPSRNTSQKLSSSPPLSPPPNPTPSFSPTTTLADTACEQPTPSSVNPQRPTPSPPQSSGQGNHLSSKTCSHCGKIYAHRSSLSKHIKKVHSLAAEDSRGIQCNMCCKR